MTERSAFTVMRQDEREARRLIIIEATISMLGQRNFFEIGMRDIAAEVGISAAAIYRYFASREDLLAEAVMHQVLAIREEFNRRMNIEHLSIEAFSEYIVDHLVKHEATFQLMSYLMAVGQMSPQVREKFDEVQSIFLSGFSRVLEYAGNTGDLRIFSQAFFAALAGVALTFRNYTGRKRSERDGAGPQGSDLIPGCS